MRINLLKLFVSCSLFLAPALAQALADLSDSSVIEIPRQNSNDFNPMWIGSKIYFLSDRKEPVTPFSYDVAGKSVTEVVKNEGLDLKSAAATSDAIVYELGCVRSL